MRSKLALTLLVSLAALPLRAETSAGRYDPKAYLAQRAASGSLLGIGVRVATGPAPIIALGVACEQDAVATACQPGEPGCNKVLERATDNKHERLAASNTELAQQVLGMVYDSCRPLGKDSSGFRPEVGVGVDSPSDLAALIVDKRPRVSASIGVNGSF